MLDTGCWKLDVDCERLQILLFGRSPKYPRVEFDISLENVKHLYHLVRYYDLGVTSEEVEEVIAVGFVVGGLS